MPKSFNRKDINALPDKSPTLYNCHICSTPLTIRYPQICDSTKNESFSVLACPKCGIGYTAPHPTESKQYYDENYYGNRHGITSQFCSRRSLNFLENKPSKTNKKRLLDIGCGDGSFLLAAKGNGWKVMGTELNPHPARALGLDVKYSLEQVNEIETFDCITMWHSLEHMADIKSTLRLIKALLAPKGDLIITVPNNDSLQAKVFGPKWFHLDVPRHVYHFNPGSLCFALENEGFRTCRPRYVEIEYNLIGWSQSALNFLSPTRNVFFDVLTRKQIRTSVWTKTTNVIFGFILTAVFSLMLPLEISNGRNGTFLILARKE